MRRQSRELALQLLFQLEYTPTVAVDKIIEMTDAGLDAHTKNYGIEVFQGVQKHKAEIDQLISTNSQHWKLERMPLVDRNILRLAIFEMVFMSEPLKSHIVINEAIELAKVFSGSDSGAFINGLLDQISKSKNL